MFGDFLADFLALAFDEIINVGAKLKFLGLDNGRYILRVSNADLGRGYGPTHSQNLDALLGLTPDLLIVDANPFIDYQAFFYDTLSSRGPIVLLSEHRSTYNLSGAIAESW